MIPYSEFQLSEKQINHIKAENQRRAIRKYIKENGEEPDLETAQSFYVATEEDIERFRSVCYSISFEREINENSQPITPSGNTQPQENKLVWQYFLMNGKAWIRGVVGNQVLYEWVDDEEMEQTKSFYGDECVLSIVELSRPVEVYPNTFIVSAEKGYFNNSTGEKFEFNKDILVYFSDNESKLLRRDNYGSGFRYNVQKWHNSFVVKVGGSNNDAVVYDYEGNLISDWIDWGIVQWFGEDSRFLYFIDPCEFYYILGYGNGIENSAGYYGGMDYSIEISYRCYKEQFPEHHWIGCRFFLPEEYENKKKRIIGITKIETVPNSYAEDVTFEFFTIDGEHLLFTYRFYKYEGEVNWVDGTISPELEPDEFLSTVSGGVYTIYKLLEISKVSS